MRKLTNAEKTALFKRRQKANAAASLRLEGFTVLTTKESRSIRPSAKTSDQFKNL